MIWLKPEVALAQRELVEKELKQPWPNTFHVFIRAVKSIDLQHAKTILDAGCGVGHYGVLCSIMFPNLFYTGTDFSEHMLHQARELAPKGKFTRCEFFQNEFSSFDICFTGGTIEYTRSPWDALDLLLESASKYIILHRLHLTKENSHKVLEPSYCGYSEHKMHWNEKEIRETVMDYDYEIIFEEYWDQTLTLVLQ
jgi:trans-aconitate methyltransferase